MSNSQDSPQTTPRKKMGKSRTKCGVAVRMNGLYNNEDFKKQFHQAFTQKSFTEHDAKAVLYNEPFQACLLPDIIQEDQFMEGLRDEVLDQIFYEKNNDLYKFQQSGDLKKSTAAHIRALRKFLYEDFLDWLRDITGIPLTNKVDMTCSRYDYTDTLLCHDDELDSRRIAYILYLVPQWSAQDGGLLDLFGMDEHGQPKDVKLSLVPQWNSLAWFEVTEASHHQVSEVLHTDKTRLSINGWFHGPAVDRPARYIEPRLPLQPHIPFEDDPMVEWINPIYLDPEVQGHIQEKFESDSEIELQGFLKDDKYQELMKAFDTATAKSQWKRRGPPNKRNYNILAEEDIPETVQKCLNFLKSESVFLTLSNLTGLTLHPLAAGNESSESENEAAGCSDPRAMGDICEEMPSPSETQPHATEKVKPQKKRRKLNSESEAREASETRADTENMTEGPRSPRCRAEVRRWSHGCYTLVHDTDAQGAEFALDAILFCGCKGWKQEYGGYTSYIAKGEDEELLTVGPVENSLALVYRDKDTLKFVKHINSKVKELAPDTEFCDLTVTYYE